VIITRERHAFEGQSLAVISSIWRRGTASERVFTQHPQRRFQIRQRPTVRRQWNKDIGILLVPNNVARTNVGARAFWLWDVAVAAVTTPAVAVSSRARHYQSPAYPPA
jgi:hypothetical protein